MGEPKPLTNNRTIMYGKQVYVKDVLSAVEGLKKADYKIIKEFVELLDEFCREPLKGKFVCLLKKFDLNKKEWFQLKEGK